VKLSKIAEKNEEKEGGKKASGKRKLPGGPSSGVFGLGTLSFLLMGPLILELIPKHKEEHSWDYGRIEGDAAANEPLGGLKALSNGAERRLEP